MPDRHYWYTKAIYDAECDDCGWTCASANAQGVAAQHHDRTGHTVRVEINRTVVYETKERSAKRFANKD